MEEKDRKPQKQKKDYKKKDVPDNGDLEKELERIQKERDEYLDGWRRSKADLVNFKKETTEALGEIADDVRIRFAKSLLPVVDALEASGANNVEGLANIKSLFLDILKNEGVTEIIAKKGDTFDPHIHEAVQGEGEAIDEVIQKGYYYKDRVLRPVKVKVSNSS